MNRAEIIYFSQTFFIILGNLLTYAIIIRILLSWFNMGGFKQKGNFSLFIDEITNPIINLAKKLPHRIGMMDFAPLIALIGLDLIVSLITILLSKLA